MEVLTALGRWDPFFGKLPPEVNVLKLLMVNERETGIQYTPTLRQQTQNHSISLKSMACLDLWAWCDRDWLGIPEKVEDQCTTLSGGQKRRLWVATALLGETPVVFLDEPTSGMDPSSRRQLWELLLQIRAAGLILFGGGEGNCK